MGTKRLPALGVAAAVALLAVAAVVFLSLRAGESEHGPIRSAEATRVADAARAVVVPVADGPATGVVVLAAPGVGLTRPPPSATPTTHTPEPVLVGEGTPAPDVTAVVEETPTPRVVVDPGRGIAAVRLEGTPGASVPLGRSHDLRPGDELIFASGAGDPVVVRFVGQATVRLGTSILSQLLLDLELAAGGTPSQGAVLDRQGRLVGIVVPERQTGAPLGHVYAVPVEQTADLLSRIGAATG